MIQNVLQSIGGIGLYGIVSLCLFFGVFLGVVVWVVRLRKPYLDSMRDLPLEGEKAPEPASDENPSSPERHE